MGGVVTSSKLTFCWGVKWSVRTLVTKTSSPTILPAGKKWTVHFKDTTNKFVSDSTKLAIERVNMMDMRCNNCNHNIGDPFMTLNCM